MTSANTADRTKNGLAPLIAVVGCDGSGKSTLTADLVTWMSGVRPARTCYLGLRSGDMGNRIKQWPIIGKRFEAYLSRKAAAARNKESSIPGLATAMVIYMLSCLRRWRFKRMLSMRRSGILIITDRYPQTEVPGFYDGPGLSAARAETALVKWLSRRELAMYERMAAFVPDLVVRLNIDVETAHSRKPDDKLSSLEAKVAVTPLLRFNGAEIIDLSSLDPYEQMLTAAKHAIHAALTAAGQSAPPAE